MAQQDIVAARTSSFAQLLMALDKLLEPSEAEKRANDLTLQIRARQMEMQMTRDAQNLETAVDSQKLDSDLASAPELLETDFSFAGEAQHRFGLYRFGNMVNGPLVQSTNPGEITRSIWNGNRYMKGSHDKLVNPVTVAAAVFASPTLPSAGLRATFGLAMGKARLKLIQRLAPLSAKNVKLLKELNTISPKLAKAYEKALPILEKNLKASGTFGGTITAGAVFSQMSGVSDYLASTPSFFDKNQHAASRNSYFQPKVFGDMNDGVATLKKLYNQVDFAAQQGIAMPESYAMLVKKMREINMNYSQDSQAGSYIHHELYTNYKPDEMMEFREGKKLKTKLVREQFELDGKFLNDALLKLNSYGEKQGYSNLNRQGY